MKKLVVRCCVPCVSAVMRIMVRMRGSFSRIRMIRGRLRLRLSVLSYAWRNIIWEEPCTGNRATKTPQWVANVLCEKPQGQKSTYRKTVLVG